VVVMIVAVDIGGIVVSVAGLVVDVLVFVVRAVCYVAAFVGVDVVVLSSFAPSVIGLVDFAVVSSSGDYLADQQHSLSAVVASISLVTLSFAIAVVCFPLVTLVLLAFLEAPLLCPLFCHPQARPRQTGYHRRSRPRIRSRSLTSLLVP